jgi:hypothetical protein
MAAAEEINRERRTNPMAAKVEEQETRQIEDIDQAAKEHAEKNRDIAEALELMKQAQTVRNLPLHVLDRFSYHSLE